MASLMSIVTDLTSSSSFRNDDDSSDRLNYRYTTTVLIAFVVVISSKQFVGEPIQCWSPKYFSETQEHYTNSFCWIRNTYFHPFDRDITEFTGNTTKLERTPNVVYYQWVPLLLLVQALFFYLPCLLWRTISERSGIDLNGIVKHGVSLTSARMDPAVLETQMKRIATQMNRYLHSFRPEAVKLKNTGSNKNILSTAESETTESETTCFGNSTKTKKPTISIQSGWDTNDQSGEKAIFYWTRQLWGRRSAHHLTSMYILVKVLYIINVIAQIFVLNGFLSTDFNMYGIRVLGDLAAGNDWTASERFPRVTMCDFKVRRLGNVNRYTVQCALPINLFNEKIFLFLWCWFVFVAIVSVGSFVVWLMKALATKKQMFNFVRKQLLLGGKIYRNDKKDKAMTIQFVNKYLRKDGVFVLRFLSQSTNVITVMELTSELWEVYQQLAMGDVDVEQKGSRT